MASKHDGMINNSINTEAPDTTILTQSQIPKSPNMMTQQPVQMITMKKYTNKKMQNQGI